MNTFPNHRLGVLTAVAIMASPRPSGRRGGHRRRRTRRPRRSPSKSSPASTRTPSCVATSPTSHRRNPRFTPGAGTRWSLDVADLSNVAVAGSPSNPAPSSPGTPIPARSSSTSPRANSSTCWPRTARAAYTAGTRFHRPRSRDGPHGLQPHRWRDRARRHVHRSPRRRTTVDHRRHHRTSRQLRPPHFTPQLTHRLDRREHVRRHAAAGRDRSHDQPTNPTRHKEQP